MALLCPKTGELCPESCTLLTMMKVIMQVWLPKKQVTVFPRPDPPTSDGLVEASQLGPPNTWEGSHPSTGQHFGYRMVYGHIITECNPQKD